MSLGYDQPLYILAFDHRGSFQKKMFGIEGVPNAQESATIGDAKALIFEGLQQAISDGVAREHAGALVDEQFGADIARKAIAEGCRLAMPVEKSGQDEFDFDYGDEFGAHVESFDPTFTKVLVRYNPEGDAAMNDRQTARLRRLSNWLHQHDRLFLFELLVPAEKQQLDAVGGNADRYDAEVRPGLMLGAISALQKAGVEPDIWKIEGIDAREDCERIAQQVRSDGRDAVSCVVLGRGANSEKVDHWLRQGAGVPGYVGFAIGRTIWWDAIKGYLDGSIPRLGAARQISINYRHAIDVYSGAS